MESTIVIKVKYGDTLRRFNALVTNQELDLNMDGLRGKIFSLFKFAPDTELTLTYLDEDGDVVTLVDDEDLCDVVRQALNPVRIMVSLRTEKSSKPSIRSSGSSTPLRSPRVQHPLQNLNSGVSEIMKSIPEPLREPLSKLSSDFALRAASTAPNLAEVVESFSKLGLSYLNQLSELQAGGVSNITDEGSKVPEGSKVSGEPSSKFNNVVPESKLDQSPKNDKLNLKNVDGDMEVGAPQSAILPTSGCAVFNSSRPMANSFSSPDLIKLGSSQDAASKNEEVRKRYIHGLSGKEVGLTQSGAITETTSLLANNIKDGSKHSEIHLDGAGSSSGLMNCIPPSTQPVDITSGMRKKSTGGFENKYIPRFLPSQMNECPFTGMPIRDEPAIPQNVPREAAFKRSCSHADGIFHRGVRCDGCGVHPITGPRFKSKVKENYDLCSICFVEIGNDADYIRIDRPVIYRQPLSFKGPFDHHTRARPQILPQVFRGSGPKPSRPKLDSRFIQDVNVLDGTLIAPSTAFTKIWRMRNNGTTFWPQGSRLVWIGGDRLTDMLSVELEIGAAGFPVEQELDVAVDFVTPELPGRYISYWRMASPYGQKFGQRVWVLIQVDASMKEPVHEVMHGFNLNWPPASGCVTAPEVENSNPEPIVDDHLSEPNNINVLVETVDPSVNAEDANQYNEANFPINNSLLVGGGALNLSPSVPSSSVPQHPIIDLSEEVTPAVPTPADYHLRFEQASGVEVKENNMVEETLLNELEEMGFKQIDLNKKVLRMNRYDLEQSVDDLCGVSEWDPILEELEEMGFCDKETNKKLLEKNNGSIKRVVMDLIAGETQ